MYNRKLLVIIVIVAIVVITVVPTALFLSSPKGLQCGYTETEGFLELRAYPKLSDSVPTVMVYVVVPMYRQQEIYLTEDGRPVSALAEFAENDLVKIDGALYSRAAVDASETYWMLEVFEISAGD